LVTRCPYVWFVTVTFDLLRLLRCVYVYVVWLFTFYVTVDCRLFCLLIYGCYVRCCCCVVTVVALITFVVVLPTFDLFPRYIYVAGYRLVTLFDCVCCPVATLICVTFRLFALFDSPLLLYVVGYVCYLRCCVCVTFITLRCCYVDLRLRCVCCCPVVTRLRCRLRLDCVVRLRFTVGWLRCGFTFAFVTYGCVRYVVVVTLLICCVR